MNIRRPDFSVLLSLYNNESPKYLRACLHSIEQNTIQPTQIVMVYDGPIDDSLKSVVNDFSHRMFVDIVPIHENVGLGKALNLGLKFCKYEIVFRMDTDDICSPCRFEKQIDFIMQNPSVAILGSAIEEFDDDMNVSRGVRFSSSGCDDIKNYAKKRNPLNHMTVVFKKSIIESVGGYQHHQFMEDYNLWLRVLAEGHQINNLPDILVSVRGGDSMISRRKGMKYIVSEFQLARLKYSLKLDSTSHVALVSFIRIVPRVLPTSLLKFLYKNLRR